MKFLRTSLLLCVILFAGVDVYAQYKVQNFFRGLKNDTNVMSMTFGGDMLKTMLSSDSLTLRSDVENAMVVICKDQDLAESLKSKLFRGIEKDAYDLLISTRNGSSTIKAYGLSTEDAIQSLTGYVISDTQRLYFFIKGNILYDELQNLQFDALAKRI